VLPGCHGIRTCTAGPGVDFENAVANAFWEVWRRRDSIDQPRAYLYSCIRRALRDTRVRRELATGITDQHTRALFLMARMVDPAEAVEFRDVLKVLHEVLSEKQRIAYYLKVAEGWRAGDIAEFLDCSPATVRVHLAEARRRLRGVERQADTDPTVTAKNAEKERTA
jgi:RNA polymerase sigma factor (sigma-70 family)